VYACAAHVVGCLLAQNISLVERDMLRRGRLAARPHCECTRRRLCFDRFAICARQHSKSASQLAVRAWDCAGGWFEFAGELVITSAQACLFLCDHTRTHDQKIMCIRPDLTLPHHTGLGQFSTRVRCGCLQTAYLTPHKQPPARARVCVCKSMCCD
jgi:hypothetical protein